MLLQPQTLPKTSHRHYSWVYNFVRDWYAIVAIDMILSTSIHLAIRGDILEHTMYIWGFCGGQGLRRFFCTHMLFENNF